MTTPLGVLDCGEKFSNETNRTSLRILWLSMTFPRFPYTAQAAWNYLILNKLSKHHQITYVPLHPISENEAAFLRQRKIFCLAERNGKIPTRASERFFHLSWFLQRIQLPWWPAPIFFWAREYQRRWGPVFHKIKENDYDLIYCEQTPLSPVMNFLPDRIPKFLSVHDLWTLHIKRRLPYESGWKKLKMTDDAQWIEQTEIEALRRADVCFAMSEPDKQWIERHSNKRAVVIPVGIDVDYYSQVVDQFSLPPSTGPWFAFSASVGHPPNADAIFYFVRQILPLIRKQYPNVGFMIVGCYTTQALYQLSRQDSKIIVTGAVPDVRPYLRAADVCVVPMRFGSGIRIKIMEYLAMGKPVVSTSIGCEGLGLVSGKHLIQADTPQDFAKGINKILSDENLRKRFAQEGPSFARSHFHFEDLLAAIEKEWFETIAGLRS